MDTIYNTDYTEPCGQKCYETKCFKHLSTLHRKSPYCSNGAKSIY